MRQNKYIISISTILLFLSNLVFGQIQTDYIKHNQIDPNYPTNEDSSAVSRNTANQVDKLFLFIGGTNSSSSTAYNALRLHSVNLGFDFINLSYPNSVPAASLSNSSDNLVFDKYRQEICFGTPTSTAVSVDSLNSIYTRTVKLIEFLDVAYPAENWDQYLSGPNSIDWSKVVVGGHSQGAGHAAYLAKQYTMERVLLFSGPNDYSDFFSSSANWLSQPGATSAFHHFGYLSLNDEAVDYAKQYANFSALEIHNYCDSFFVDNISPPYNFSHSLYTTQLPGLVLLNHNVPIKLSATNSEVWTYMLTTTLEFGLQEVLIDKVISAFPNPSSGIFKVQLFKPSSTSELFVLDLFGNVCEEIPVSNNEISIDLSHLSTGIYLLKFDQKVLRIFKK